LPRGLPSDGVFDRFGEEDEARQEALQEEARREALLLEEMRLKFEFEELLNLKSELERRKKTERREINELQEEIATMQTLYQYRTYSIDSSEESSGEEDEGKGQQQRQQESLKALAASLPPGWELRESRSKKGVYYYANPALGLSQNERPKA